MRRDATGKFTSNWDLEAKRRVSITLTNTAWRLLKEKAQEHKISRSEVIERTARSFATAKNQQLEAQSNAVQQVVAGVAIDLSDQLQAEAGLQQRETELHLITNALPVLISFVDVNQRYRFVNQTYEEWFGRPASEVYGKYLWEVLGESAYETIRPYVEQVLAGHRLTFESKIPYKDAGTRFVSITYVPRWDPQGRVEGFVALVSDITQRQQAEETLRQSEERLRIAQQAANAGVWDWDITTNQVSWSAEYYRLYGLDPAITQPSYENWLNSIVEQDRDRVNRAAHEALEQQIDLNVEFRVLHPTRGERWLTAIGQTFYDDKGQPRRMIGIALDVTKRKQAEQALRESEEWARLAIQVARLGGWRLHLDTNLVEMDKRMREIWGEPDDAVMVPLARVVARMHADDRSRVADAVNAAIAPQSTGIYEIDYRIVWKDGTERWVLAKGQAQFEGEGESRRTVDFFGTLLDITDRKQTEAELQQREQEFRTLVENTPDIIVRYDRGLRHLYINPSIERALGLPPAQFIGKTGVELGFTDARSQTWHTTVQQVFETGQSRSLEYEFPSPDGKLHFYQARFVPELVAGEHIATVVGVVRDVTEYKRAEISLRQSEERLRLAMEGAQMGTWDVDLKTGKAIWSEQHFTMLGYEPVATGEASEEMWSSRIHPDDLQRVIQAWQQSRLDHALYQAEYRVIRADNSQIAWLAGLGSFTYDQTGEASRSIGVIFDITDRKQIEAELRESEQRLQLAQQAGRIGTWEWNLLTNQISWSDGIWTLLALEPNSITPSLETFTHFLHPDDREQAFAGVEVALAQGDSYYDEFRVIRQDGVVCWLLSKGRVIRNEDGQPERLLGINIDITDRKRSEAALRQSEERYRYLAESIPQLVWTANAEGTLIDVNQRWSSFTGLTLAQAQTDGWRAIVHPDDVPILSQNWAIAQQNGTYYQAEGRMRRVDGVYRWHLHQAVPLKNEQGQLIKWFGTATDIEEQKQIEQQRIHLLQQEQAAREQAEAANRIKDEFLAVLSHELRTPLNPILGWIRLLRTRQFDRQSADRALDTIERNAKLQAQLIEDLLDISRILQGKTGLNIGPVNLSTVVEAALETVRLSAEAKGIQIQAILDPEVGPINGDANRLQQVLWNLLSNAIKFTPSGGRVEVKLESDEFSVLSSQLKDATQNSNLKTQNLQRYAQITVTDTGKGISPDFLPYVFEYFRQADSSTTRQFGGLGLGLAIVRHLVELHGGTVKAASPGHGMGATFTVQLPLVVSALTPDAEGLPTQETKNLNGICILIVDDDADMRDLLCFILAEQGATVIVAASAVEALQQLTESVPDVLISDIGMPEMDGYALMRQIRTTLSKQGKMIPAIALTAYAGDLDQRQALAAGFQKHIAKPVEPETLVQTIATLLEPAISS